MSMEESRVALVHLKAYAFLCRSWKISKEWTSGLLFALSLIRFADAWDEEDKNEQEEEREVAEVAVTGNGLNLRQSVQADLLNWIQNNMLL